MKTRLFSPTVAAGLLAAVTCAHASPYLFTSSDGGSAWIDVEYWTGTGSSQTLLIVDWNNATTNSTTSYAFGYRWDGSATTEADMLADIAANGALDISTGYGGAFIYNIYYTNSAGNTYEHTEEGSWNLASTGNVFAQWGDFSEDWTKIGEWSANTAGLTDEYIADGHLEGINLIWWFDASKNNQNLDIPYATVPEPASAALLTIASLITMAKKH